MASFILILASIGTMFWGLYEDRTILFSHPIYRLQNGACFVATAFFFAITALWLK